MSHSISTIKCSKNTAFFKPKAFLLKSHRIMS